MPMAGVHTQIAPQSLRAELAAAKLVLADMARLDQGQAMLLRDGQVIACEDERGTAAMAQDFCDPPEQDNPIEQVFGIFGEALEGVADWLSGQDYTRAPGADAVLFKAPKPGQNLLADMPMIGPDTAMKAAEAGLSGIVVPVGGVMVLDLPQVVAILNAQDMFLWVMPEEAA